MRPADRTDYIVRCIEDSGAMYEGDARAFLAAHDAEVLAEAHGEAYPGELAHLRDLLRQVCRLEGTLPDGGPLRELLVDHYSDTRMVDASLRRAEVERAPTCTAEYGGPGYTHCELPTGHSGQHESALGNLRRAKWGGA